MNEEGDQALADTFSEVKEKRSLLPLLQKTPYSGADSSDTNEEDFA